MAFDNINLVLLLEHEKFSEFLNSHDLSIQLSPNLSLEQFTRLHKTLYDNPNPIMIALLIGDTQKALELIKSGENIFITKPAANLEEQREKDWEVELSFYDECMGKLYDVIISALKLALDFKQDDVVRTILQYTNKEVKEKIKFQLDMYCYLTALNVDNENTAYTLQQLNDFGADFNIAILWAVLNENAIALKALLPYSDLSTLNVLNMLVEEEKYGKILDLLFNIGIKPNKLLFDTYLAATSDLKYHNRLFKQFARDDLDEFTVVHFATAILRKYANETDPEIFEKIISQLIDIITKSLSSSTDYSTPSNPIAPQCEADTIFTLRVKNLFECYGKLLQYQGVFTRRTSKEPSVLEQATGQYNNKFFPLVRIGEYVLAPETKPSDSNITDGVQSNLSAEQKEELHKQVGSDIRRLLYRA